MYLVVKSLCSKTSRPFFVFIYHQPVLLNFSFRTPKKPKSKKLSFIGPPARISSNGTVPHSYDGSRDSPIPVTSDNDDDRKRKLSEEQNESQQKKRKTELRAFHPELEAAIEDLKAEIAKGDHIARARFLFADYRCRVLDKREVPTITKAFACTSGSQSCGVRRV